MLYDRRGRRRGPTVRGIRDSEHIIILPSIYFHRYSRHSHFIVHHRQLINAMNFHTCCSALLSCPAHVPATPRRCIDRGLSYILTTGLCTKYNNYFLKTYFICILNYCVISLTLPVQSQIFQSWFVFFFFTNPASNGRLICSVRSFQCSPLLPFINHRFRHGGLILTRQRNIVYDENIHVIIYDIHTINHCHIVGQYRVNLYGLQFISREKKTNDNSPNEIPRK